MAVKSTVAAPVAPHRSLSVVKLLLHTTPEHTSAATAPPLDANHALSCAVLPMPLHSTVKFAAWVVMAGAVSSTMVKVAVVVE